MLTRRALFCLFVLIAGCGGFREPEVKPEQPSVPPRALQLRSQEFLRSVDYVRPEGLIDFFPQMGIFTYRTTVYSDEGASTLEWQFPASEIHGALIGSLRSVFAREMEGQVVGRFVHQLWLRGRAWVYVGGNRFVPPKSDASSAIYVQWRLDEGKWVIAELADEEYHTDHNLPSWCCE